MANPATFEGNLAICVNNLASFLRNTGNLVGALMAGQEAVEIFKRLARANPAAYEPDLATSVNNLSNHLSKTGDRAGALSAAQEALGLYEQVNSRHTGLFEAELERARRLVASLKESS
jgi:tetratricopeptide (TPR) repeat protein